MSKPIDKPSILESRPVEYISYGAIVLLGSFIAAWFPWGVR